MVFGPFLVMRRSRPVAPRAKSTLLVRLFLASVLLLFPGRPEAVAAPLRTFPFWACSDGKGTVTLFWLPPDGQWPAGGFRLDRIVRKQRVLLAKVLGPGLDGEALAALPPGDAEGIQAIGDKIRGGTLTDEERRHSISVMGKAAATDVVYGRALGVRYTDRVKGGGKLLYRLTALDADGKPGDAMESNEVDALKRTPGPAQPLGLAAEEHPGAVALIWSDPPASVLAPVVAFRVERIAGRGKALSLTPTPLVLNRHLTAGRPDFLDSDPPREQLVYRVRSIDIFGRVSAPTRVAISAKNLAPAEKKPESTALASKPPEPAVGPVSSRKAAAEKEIPVRQERIASVSSPGPGVAAATESRKGEGNPEADRESRTARVVSAEGKPAPAAPKSGAGFAPSSEPTVVREARPPPPAEPPAEIAGPGPGRGSGEVRVAAVKEEAVSAPALSRGGSASPAEPARADSYPVVRPGPKPGRSDWNTGVPEAEPSSKIPASRESGAGRMAAAVRQEAGPPSPPMILSVVGLGDKVSITFRPGQEHDRVSEFLLYRSESPSGPGVVVGRPIPGDARKWEDTTVEAGQYFWYRLVAVDRAGNRSDPSRPKWVAVGSH